MLSRRVVLVTVSLIVAAFFFGWLAGLKSEHGAKTLSTATCDAVWAGGPMAHCDEVDGDGDFAFDVDDLQWSTTRTDGEGRPPCLKRDRSVRIEVGYLDVRQPNATVIEDVVMWVRCS